MSHAYIYIYIYYLHSRPLNRKNHDHLSPYQWDFPFLIIFHIYFIYISYIFGLPIYILYTKMIHRTLAARRRFPPASAAAVCGAGHRRPKRWSCRRRWVWCAAPVAPIPQALCESWEADKLELLKIPWGIFIIDTYYMYTYKTSSVYIHIS